MTLIKVPLWPWNIGVLKKESLFGNFNIENTPWFRVSNKAVEMERLIFEIFSQRMMWLFKSQEFQKDMFQWNIFLIWHLVYHFVIESQRVNFIINAIEDLINNVSMLQSDSEQTLISTYEIKNDLCVINFRKNMKQILFSSNEFSFKEMRVTTASPVIFLQIKVVFNFHCQSIKNFIRSNCRLHKKFSNFSTIHL